MSSLTLRWAPEWASKVRAFLRALREVLYGMTTYEMEKTVREQRTELADLFTLIVFGDLIGLPVLPPHYALRLLPSIVPELPGWKRRILREREVTELEDFHLH
ncbi:MAG: hypothetical protein KatS3mg061_2776 [Dehalococcoidia bacterium]|nr:MAG: hypothetical protein KatS3mg061_2776 [Dehalococcoidia bacterium]